MPWTDLGDLTGPPGAAGAAQVGDWTQIRFTDFTQAILGSDGMGWQAGIGNAGASVSYLGWAKSYGLWGLPTGVTSSGFSSFGIGSSYINLVGPGIGFDIAWRFGIPLSSSAADNFRALLGFGDGWTYGPPSSYFAIEVGNSNNNNIRIAYGNYSAPTYVDTGVSMAINTLHTVRLVMNQAWTTLLVYVDGVLTNTISSPSIPVQLFCGAGIFKTGGTIGTTDQMLVLDAYQERVYAGNR